MPAIDDPAGLPDRSRGEFSLFGNTIEELSHWHCFSPKEPKIKERTSMRWDERQPGDGSAINLFKAVGRNDPCPCGSGRKFKKCCLTARAGPTALQTL